MRRTSLPVIGTAVPLAVLFAVGCYPARFQSQNQQPTPYPQQYPQQQYPQYPQQQYPQQQYPQAQPQYAPGQYQYPQPQPQQAPPQPQAQPQPQQPFPFQLPAIPSGFAWPFPALPGQAPAPAPSPSPSPNPGAGCPVTTSPQTWIVRIASTGPQLVCPASKDNMAVVIMSTGPTTASVSFETHTDSGASFDPNACRISHGAPGTSQSQGGVTATATYDLSIGPDGTLSGTGGADLCIAKYSVSGTKR